jgi:hypothetical protein
MESLADDGTQLLPTSEEKFNTGPSWSTRVEEKILGRALPAHSDERNGEDFVTGVGGVELIHGHCHVRAFDGASLNIATCLPGDFLSYVSLQTSFVM